MHWKHFDVGRLIFLKSLRIMEKWLNMSQTHRKCQFYVYLVCIMTRTNIQPTLMFLVMSNYYVIQFGYEDLLVYNY